MDISAEVEEFLVAYFESRSSFGSSYSILSVEETSSGYWVQTNHGDEVVPALDLMAFAWRNHPAVHYTR